MSFASHPNADEFVVFIEELADAARELLAAASSAGLFETKEDASPVTEFDRGVEDVLRRRIRDRYPEHGIVGEEFEPENAEAEFVWIMDPIDGTKSFVTGIPTHTSLIALCWRGAPVLGIIDASATEERWLGIEGRPTTLNGEVIRCSGRTEVSGAILSWSEPQKVLDQHRRGYELLRERTAWSIYGAASYGFGRLAAGSLDIAIYSGGFGSYDVCALVPIVEGAGGAISDDRGRPITIETPTACVASGSAELQREVLELLGRS